MAERLPIIRARGLAGGQSGIDTQAPDHAREFPGDRAAVQLIVNQRRDPGATRPGETDGRG